MKNYNSLNEKGIEEPLFFYHLIDKQHKKSEGILSLEYMYRNNKSLYIKNTEKYRNRLCNDWGIYPNKNPKDLTLKEIYEGINKFRKDKNGNNYIYLFRYPPYKLLDRQFQEIYKYKKNL